MAKFHDLIASLGMGEDGLTAYPETFTDDLTAAYDEDFSIPSARVEVLEADLAAATAEITRLKAHNYELLMQIPAEESVDDAPVEGDGDNDDNADEGVDSLFGDDKESE